MRGGAEVGDQERQRPEAEHERDVVGDRGMAVGKAPDPRGDCDPKGDYSAGERPAVGDAGRAESFHSFTSNIGPCEHGEEQVHGGKHEQQDNAAGDRDRDQSSVRRGSRVDRQAGADQVGSLGHEPAPEHRRRR